MVKESVDEQLSKALRAGVRVLTVSRGGESSPSPPVRCVARIVLKMRSSIVWSDIHAQYRR